MNIFSSGSTPAAAELSPTTAGGVRGISPRSKGEDVIQKNWQELIRPNKLQVSAGGDAARVATVVAEPLERGAQGQHSDAHRIFAKRRCQSLDLF